MDSPVQKATPDQGATPRSSPAPTTLPQVKVSSSAFDPSDVSALAGAQFDYVWTGSGDSAVIVAADANNRQVTLFGGDGVYTILNTGTVLTVSTSIPDGNYTTYLTVIGGPVRGTVNVRRGK